jgi:cell division septation protein DedD
VPTPAGSDPTIAAPPPAVDELSYFNRLDAAGQAAEVLKPAVTSLAEKSSGSGAAAANKVEAKAATKAEAPRSTATSASAPAAPPSAEPAPTPGGKAFVVQVAAVRERSEADAISQRLSTKGYAAYVLAPAGGTPAVYRVRVGKFNTKREAQAMATRLKNEQFKPWITAWTAP